MELIGDPTAGNKKYAQIDACYDAFVKDLPMTGTLTESDFILAKQKLDVAAAQIKELNKYYKSSAPRVVYTEKAFNGILENLKSGKIEEKNQGTLLANVVTGTLKEFRDLHWKNIYKKLTPEVSRKMFAAADARNKSMIAEIEKYRSEGRRVFVIVGAAHIFGSLFHKGNRDVKPSLRKHKFTIVTRKNELSGIVGLLNTDLKSVKLK